MQKLWKNKGGYFGETIDIRKLVADAKAFAQKHGWTSELFCKIDDLEILALHRVPETGIENVNARIYISAGIHGDEPAGPLATLRLLRENVWPKNVELWLLPCLNPTGFILNSRENEGRKDLNRDYRHLESIEIAAHVRWLERQPKLDLYLCLHEDWESHGFYLYEQNPDDKKSLAEEIIREVRRVCPIDESEIIEGRPAYCGVIRPNIKPHERPDWPEAFYLISHKARQGYTLEAPSDFPMNTRVDALVAAVHAALANFS